MKKIILFLLCLAVLIATSVFAGGSSVYNDTFTLQSGATGTTGAYTTGHATFAAPVSSLGIDVSSSPTVTVVVRIDGNAAHTGGFDASGLATATTCTRANCYFAITGKPVKTVQSVITAGTSTAVVTVNVTGMQ